MCGKKRGIAVDRVEINSISVLAPLAKFHDDTVPPSKTICEGVNDITI